MRCSESVSFALFAFSVSALCTSYDAISAVGNVDRPRARLGPHERRCIEEKNKKKNTHHKPRFEGYSLDGGRRSSPPFFSCHFLFAFVFPHSGEGNTLGSLFGNLVFFGRSLARMTRLTTSWTLTRLVDKLVLTRHQFFSTEFEFRRKKKKKKKSSLYRIHGRVRNHLLLSFVPLQPAKLSSYLVIL